MRDIYQGQLKSLHEQMVHMATLCEEAISKATEALTEGNVALAQEVIGGDVIINQKEREIESLCMKLILHQQPVAGDLRRISAILKLLTDIERIGDQAADIAEIVKDFKLKLPEKYSHICKMGVAAIKMVTDSVDAYINEDLALAKSVIDYDDVVDRLFMEIRKEILEDIATAEGVDGEMLLDLFMITKYYEKIGDHATNVAEWVCYSITGDKV